MSHADWLCLSYLDEYFSCRRVSPVYVRDRFDSHMLPCTGDSVVSHLGRNAYVCFRFGLLAVCDSKEGSWMPKVDNFEK